MWKAEASIALEIGFRFSSMSLSKISPSGVGDAKEDYSVRLHDLHLEYAQRMAGISSVEWHRRLLNGHISPNDYSPSSNANQLVRRILDYTPRAWWQDDIDSKEYIQQNETRHLHDGDLGLELGAVVLDLRWMHAQAHTGGSLGFDNLKSMFLRLETSNRNALLIIEKIADALAAASMNRTRGLRVISFVLLSDLSAKSETDELLARFLYIVKIATPNPYLTPVISFYRPRRKGLQAVIDIKQTEQEETSSQCADFSKCEKYLVVGTGRDIVVMYIDNGEKLGQL